MDRPENVNIQVSQLVDTFKSQQHDGLDNDKLFYGHLRKCRSCFMQLTQIRGPNIIHQWHRETFMAMTGLELSRLSSESHHSNYLCLNCIELLKVFAELKVAADGMQKVQNRYIEHHRKLFEVVTEQREVEEEIDETENEDENQANDWNEEENNNIDYDGPQKPDAEYFEQYQDYENGTIAAEEFNHDVIASNQTVEIAFPAELIDKMPECSVKLERLDPKTIARYSSNKRATKPDGDSTTAILTGDSDSSTAAMKVFCCDLCGFETEIKINLTHHIDSRHKQADKQTENGFKCSIDGCNKILKNKKTLHSHRYSVHNRDSQEETTCNQCEKVFKNKATLWQHQRSHNKKHSCKICNKSFTHKSHLIDHRQTYHMSNSEFNCTKCPKTFKSQRKLKLHQRNTHDVKKLNCYQCDAAFTAPWLLTDHVKVKHEGKRYHCSHPGCSEKFKWKGYAGRHLQKVHKLNGNAFEKHYKQIKMH